MSAEEVRDEELDKILLKGFETIRKGVLSLIAKREKKVVKDMKVATKKTRENFEKEDKPKKKQSKNKSKNKSKKNRNDSSE